MKTKIDFIYLEELDTQAIIRVNISHIKMYYAKIIHDKRGTIVHIAPEDTIFVREHCSIIDKAIAHLNENN